MTRLPGALAIEGVARDYAWGSRTAIQRLLGRPEDGRPLAELWFGAHPDAPSAVPSLDTTLDAVIAADPESILGEPVRSEFGPRLPFLLKVLAADKALSIQVHPNTAQAAAGFAAEDAAGLPRDAAERNYRDPNHKPELLCALTPFEALCGFRPVHETIALLESLAIPDFEFLTRRLRGPDPRRAAFSELLDLDDPARLVAELATRASPEGPLRPVWLALQDFPGDVGVLLALLLNYVRLQPGEAVYLGAGNVHCYLRGMGVEIMANSDNVLRCGLTPKHVDVPELLKITDFTELAQVRWPATERGFEVPARDFRLGLRDLDGELALTDAGPRVVLCTEGQVEVGDVVITAGQAAFVPAVESSAPVRGQGRIFVATVGAS
ncbi:MAG TPA: mannose-6-phosphate isomerase, class I [Jatrophihabitans sp.]|jgi:mannose-6-phosphate isomerase|nr:mannose-6-phosphate isomerase, class I [Jatrophihabitans sp.]